MTLADRYSVSSGNVGVILIIVLTRLLNLYFYLINTNGQFSGAPDLWYRRASGRNFASGSRRDKFTALSVVWNLATLNSVTNINNSFIKFSIILKRLSLNYKMMR